MTIHCLKNVTLPFILRQCYRSTVEIELVIISLDPNDTIFVRSMISGEPAFIENSSFMTFSNIQRGEKSFVGGESQKVDCFTSSVTLIFPAIKLSGWIKKRNIPFLAMMLISIVSW